jgi:hypothetical protein
MSDAQVPAIDVLRKLFEDVDDDHVFDFPDDIMRAEDLKGLIATVVAGEAALTKRVIEAEAIKRAMGDRAKVVRVSQNGTPIGEPFEAPVDWVPEDQRAVDVTKAVLEVLPVEVPEGGLLHVRLGATAADMGGDMPWIPSVDDCLLYEDYMRKALGKPSREAVELGMRDRGTDILVTHRWVEVIPYAMPTGETQP